MQRTDAASKKQMLKSGDCHGGKAPPRKDKRGVYGIWEPMRNPLSGCLKRLRNSACKKRMRHPKYGCLTDASASKKRMRHLKSRCLRAEIGHPKNGCFGGKAPPTKKLLSFFLFELRFFVVGLL